MKILDYWMRYKEDELARHQIDRLLKIQHKVTVENIGIDASKQELKYINKVIGWSDRLIKRIDRDFYPSQEATK